jgi:hypothetical protein
MAFYFKNIPDFDYVSRIEGAKISDYITVKNLFKKGKLREDIFQNLAFFTKYKVIGSERPDQVAEKFYGDSTLDWVILLCNNIVNVQTEWPLSQESLDNYLLETYGDYETLNAIHHYESPEIKNSQGIVLVPEGTIVPANFFIEYYDEGIGNTVYVADIAIPVTNYEYEIRIEEKKANIYVLKPNYIGIILSDAEDLSSYKIDGDQYVNPTLKKGDDIRLYGN